MGEWLYKMVTAIVKYPARRTSVEQMMMKYIRPSEQRLLRADGVRPEVLKLKAALNLGPKAKKKFDAEVKMPLNDLLNEMREKGARRREKKLEKVIIELTFGRYMTAFRLLMKNVAGDGLFAKTIQKAMDIAKGVAACKIGNDGLAKEIGILFDKISKHNGDRFNKIREWANRNQSSMSNVEFAQKVFTECFPSAHYRMFANVFLCRTSADMGECLEPEGYGKINPKAPPLRKTKKKIELGSMEDSLEASSQSDSWVSEETGSVGSAPAPVPVPDL